VCGAGSESVESRSAPGISFDPVVDPRTGGVRRRRFRLGFLLGFLTARCGRAGGGIGPRADGASGISSGFVLAPPERLPQPPERQRQAPASVPRASFSVGHSRNPYLYLLCSTLLCSSTVWPWRAPAVPAFSTLVHLFYNFRCLTGSSLVHLTVTSS